MKPCLLLGLVRLLSRWDYYFILNIILLYACYGHLLHGKHWWYNWTTDLDSTSFNLELGWHWALDLVFRDSRTLCLHLCGTPAWHREQAVSWIWRYDRLDIKLRDSAHFACILGEIGVWGPRRCMAGEAAASHGPLGFETMCSKPWFIICAFYLRVLFSGSYMVSRMEHVPYGQFYDTRSGWRDVNYWALWKCRNVYYKLCSSAN